VEAAPDADIVFVNLDTISVQYKRLAEEVKKIETSYNNSLTRMQSQMQGIEQKAQQNVADWEAGKKTAKSRDEMNEQLTNQYQQLMNRYQSVQNQASIDLQETQQAIMQSIKTYLKQLAEIKNYQYVLADGMGSTIMYGPQALDITAIVVKGLNNQ
jgi:outer membrane protein